MRPRCDHSQQVQVRPRYIRDYPGPNDAQLRNRDKRSRRASYGNQSQQIQVRSMWDHSHKVQGRRRWQQDSPSPGEAQVATSHQIQVRTS